MNQPADDKTLLREQLDQLADNVTGGDRIDGAELYRQGIRRRRRRIAATGLIVAAVVIAGAALNSVVRPEASPDIGPAPASNPPSHAPSSDCDIPDRLKQDIELGALTEEQACRMVRQGEQEIEARQGPPDFPEGPSLVIEGYVHADLLQECRAGTSNSGVGAEALYCNAMLMIAAGELEPNGTCDPPACPEPDTPVWAYGEKELRDLADANQ